MTTPAGIEALMKSEGLKVGAIAAFKLIVSGMMMEAENIHGTKNPYMLATVEDILEAMREELEACFAILEEKDKEPKS